VVTNSFGTRNAMQPMGSIHSRRLAFFPFFLLGGGEGEGKFFSFFLGSQCVPNIFFIAPHSYPICFGKCCPPFTYIGAPKGMKSRLQNRTFYFRELP